jgi:dsRNA-specific ribonuclease
MRAELGTLESSVNHRFSNPALLDRALTHSSAANESRAGAGPALSDNEPLEFLGDSILGFLSPRRSCSALRKRPRASCRASRRTW